MKILHTSGLMLISIASSLCSCHEEYVCNEPRNPNEISIPHPSVPLSSADADAANHMTDFALGFYLESAKTSDKNVCVSPFSVASVLSMIANGDDASSRDEILSLLGFSADNDGLAQLNAYNKSITSNLPHLDEKTACIFTNSVWHRPELSLLAPFSRTLADYYFATEYPIDPRDESGRLAMNSFIETNTRGLIKDCLKQPLKSSVAFVNTSYFKGIWKYSFDKELTSKGSFLNIDYSESTVDFMHLESSVDYAVADDGTRAIRLPYGNGSFSMTLILPSDRINHVPLDEALDNDNLSSLDKKFTPANIQINLPRFEVAYQDDNAIEILKLMGIKDGCDPNHGFPLMAETTEPLILGEFIHATKLIVDEEGTEGGAVSIGGMYETSMPDPLSITFDRPFLFLIREKTTGTVLFIGSVKDLSGK